jgi:hypothetical protein
MPSIVAEQKNTDTDQNKNDRRKHAITSQPVEDDELHVQQGQHENRKSQQKDQYSQCFHGCKIKQKIANEITAGA